MGCCPSVQHMMPINHYRILNIEYTSDLAVRSWSAIGTVAVNRGMRNNACSSIITGGITPCKSEPHMQDVEFVGPTTSTHVCFWFWVLSYLCSGSRILCTHWDRHSRHRKRNYGKFLHSDRQDYRLQLYMNNYTLHESYHGSPPAFMVLYEHTFIHTSLLAVRSCVPTGTVTEKSVRTTACSSILTSRTTDCRCKTNTVTWMLLVPSAA